MKAFQFIYEKVTKHPMLLWAMIAVFAMTSILFVKHNYMLYERPIATITEVTVEDSEEITDSFQNEDTLVTQQIRAKIRNGEQKGQSIQMKNVYATSKAYDQQYQVGNDVFISVDKNVEAGEELTGSITDVKRDVQMVILIWIFIVVLLMVGKWQGFFASVSLGLNIVILSYALDLYVYHHVNLLW